MPTKQDLSALVGKIGAFEHADELARFARDCLFQQADSRGVDSAPAVESLAADRGLITDEADAPATTVVESLKTMGSSPDAALLVTALLGRALAAELPEGLEAEDQAATKLAWIAANTPVDVLKGLDEIVGEKADGLWGALADSVQRYDTRGTATRAEALAASAMLAASEHLTARKRREELSKTVRDPCLAHVLACVDTAKGQAASLSGELSRPPRGLVATVLLAMCGWLLAAHVVRLLGRFALQYRRPAEVELTARGVFVHARTLLLGKVLRERETLIPLDGLARATRELRFPRLTTYVGLIALALGSYVGVSWFVDGVRAGSVSLIGLGLLVVAVGIGLDFVLSSLLPGAKGRCCVLFVPRRGASICISHVDAKAADMTLAALAKR